MMIKGFKFGLLLQFAIGPICLFIFQTAASTGFFVAVTGVLGVTMVDAFYIYLAITGMGALLTKHAKAKKIFKYIGSLVLVLFGLSTISGAFGVSLLPIFHIKSSQSAQSMFFKTIFLTLSNPLTIIFWTGVFSTKIMDQHLSKPKMYLFGFGAVLSTLLFLTCVAGIGSIANAFIAPFYINILNIVVGAVLIVFGVKAAIKARP